METILLKINKIKDLLTRIEKLVKKNFDLNSKILGILCDETNKSPYNDRKMMIKRDFVITSFVVPWILGIGRRTPTQARGYIKNGSTLNPGYYPGNQKRIEVEGETMVFNKFMERLFDEKNINPELTELLGEKVYKPWDCLSGIFQIEVNSKLGLVSRPHGVTANNETILMTDDFIDEMTEQLKEECEIKLLATMAVWQAKKGVYYVIKSKEIFSVDFNEEKWLKILENIREWALFLYEDSVHLFQYNAKYLVFDTETTGLPERIPGKGIGKDAYYNYKQLEKYNGSRLLQIAWTCCDNHFNIIGDINTFYILPENPSEYDIHPEVIHKIGITKEKITTKGIAMDKFIDRLTRDLQKTEILVAHNAFFDINILRHELYRRKYNEPLNTINNKVEMNKVLCTLEKSRNTGNNKKVKSLDVLYETLFNKKRKKGHEAKTDIIDLIACIKQMNLSKEKNTVEETLNKEDILICTSIKRFRFDIGDYSHPPGGMSHTLEETIKYFMNKQKYYKGINITEKIIKKWYDYYEDKELHEFEFDKCNCENIYEHRYYWDWCDA